MFLHTILFENLRNQEDPPPLLEQKLDPLPQKLDSDFRSLHKHFVVMADKKQNCKIETQELRNRKFSILNSAIYQEYQQWQMIVKYCGLEENLLKWHKAH